jgi:hypothetical protein
VLQVGMHVCKMPPALCRSVICPVHSKFLLDWTL